MVSEEPEAEIAQPTRHRMMVSDPFAATNYKKRSADLELTTNDDRSAEIAPIKPNSWRRKITQSLSPWKIKVDNKTVVVQRMTSVISKLLTNFHADARDVVVISQEAHHAIGAENDGIG